MPYMWTWDDLERLDRAKTHPHEVEEMVDIREARPSDAIRTRLGMFVMANEDRKRDMELLEEQLLRPEISLSVREPMIARLHAYRESTNNVAFAFPCGRLLWSNSIVLSDASAVFEEEIRKGRKVTAYFEDGEERHAKWSPEKVKAGALDSDDEDGITVYDGPRRMITRIEVADASYKAYQALLTYVRGGTFSFSRIKSAKALSSRDTNALIDYDVESGFDPQTLQVSPKSIFLLAQKYGLKTLAHLCIASVLRQISESNAQYELFTIQTLCHTVYRRSLTQHIRENWREFITFPEASWRDLHRSWGQGEDRSEIMRRLDVFRQSALPSCAVPKEDHVRDGATRQKKRKVEEAVFGRDDGDSYDGLSWDTDDTSDEELPNLRTGPRDPATPNPKNTSIITYEEGPPCVAGQVLPPLDNWFVERFLPQAESSVKQEALEEAPSPSVSPLKRRKGVRTDQPQ